MNLELEESSFRAFLDCDSMLDRTRIIQVLA